MHTISFRRGSPPVETFPIEDIQYCTGIALQQLGGDILQYSPSKGLLLLREQLALIHNSDPEEIILGNGSLQLQHFVARCLINQPKDIVWVEEPSYDRAITAFRQGGAYVLGIPMLQDGPDVDLMVARVKEKIPRFFYTIPDFQNPTGITTSLEKRKRIVELARQYGFYIVEDIPYRKLRYWGVEISSYHELAPDISISMSSMSKLISPGLRIGWLVGPKELVNNLARIAEDTYITPAILCQGIVFEYIRQGMLEPNIDRLKTFYKVRLEAMLSAIDLYLKGKEYARPEGGFFIGINLPDTIDMDRLLKYSEMDHLLLSDGRHFFPERNQEHFLRLPFCTPTVGEIGEGVSRLSSILEGLSK